MFDLTRRYIIYTLYAADSNKLAGFAAVVEGGKL